MMQNSFYSQGVTFGTEKVSWQAHRGGGVIETPDNTLYSVQYGWESGGIPEIDMRVTADREIICLHDPTLARTTDAPEEIADIPVSELTFAEIRQYDAGRKFSESCAGQKVPALREVFEEMRKDKNRWLYIDVKNYASPEFMNLVTEYGVSSRIICMRSDYEFLCMVKDEIPGIFTGQWIGYWGEGDTGLEKMKVFRKLAGLGFRKLDQVQLHLNFIQNPSDGWHFDILKDNLLEALDVSGNYGIAFQVLPWNFNEKSIHDLLSIGIRSFAVDNPAELKKTLKTKFI